MASNDDFDPFTEEGSPDTIILASCCSAPPYVQIASGYFSPRRVIARVGSSCHVASTLRCGNSRARTAIYIS